MKQQLETIRDSALQELAETKTQAELESLRVKYLGKKGELTAILKQMGKLSAEERPVMGQLANEVRGVMEDHMAQRAAQLKEEALKARLEAEKIDVTMPGVPFELGAKHPLSIVLDEIKEIFVGMGFEIVEGPEVELDYYNFEALNIPKDHPARDTQDTFYINDNIVLRTQTSPVQIRTMEKQKPPIRIISPGRVYRSDAVDATHSPLFHQIEGLVVDKGITFGGPKGHLGNLCETSVWRRFRGSLPPSPLPLYRTLRRGRCAVLQLPWRRLPPLQKRRLDRNFRLRHGTPKSAEQLRH